MTAAVDPALQFVLRCGLSLLFLSAAAHKLRDVDAFRGAIEGYELVPLAWAVPCGAILIAAEVGIGVGLWVPGIAPIAALAAAALLALYAGAIAVNLRRGRHHIDCGCAGSARQQTIRGALVMRNGILGSIALASALPATRRPLSWIDLVTVVGGVLVLALLYAAIDTLLAIRPAPLFAEGGAPAADA